MKMRRMSKAEKRDLRDSVALAVSVLSLGVGIMALANKKRGR